MQYGPKAVWFKYLLMISSIYMQGGCKKRWYWSCVYEDIFYDLSSNLEYSHCIKYYMKNLWNPHFDIVKLCCLIYFNELHVRKFYFWDQLIFFYLLIDWLMDWFVLKACQSILGYFIASCSGFAFNKGLYLHFLCCFERDFLITQAVLYEIKYIWTRDRAQACQSMGIMTITQHTLNFQNRRFRNRCGFVTWGSGNRGQCTFIFILFNNTTNRVDYNRYYYSGSELTWE